MLRLVALVRTDVSEELSASFIRLTRIGERGTTLAVSNRHTLRKKYQVSSLGISLRSVVAPGGRSGLVPQEACISGHEYMAYPRNRPWRPTGVSSVRYEHLYMKK
jgi:hypothetical protein